MKPNYLLFVAIILYVISGCTKEGPEGKISLVKFEMEPASENCPSGGFKVMSGIDLNFDNILDDAEIMSTNYICNGKNSVMDLQPEPPGENCASGGYKVMTGIDVNNNKTLEEDEVQTIDYVCNGNNSVVGFEPEPPGENCQSGGFKVMSGIDFNNNDTLDRSEVQNIEYICNGNDGINSMFTIEPFPPGDICENGGFKLLSGLDTNWNHVLDEAEIQNIDYICNGVNGINTVYSIESERPGENCISGGFKINYGLDVNGNNTLDEDEVDDFIFICNGNDEKTIRLRIEWAEGTATIYGNRGIGIYGFNKDDYPGVDSIVFVGTPYSSRSDNRCAIDLYDFTDDRAIPGSLLYTNAVETEAKIQFSGNLFDAIPSGTRDIGVRIRSEKNGIPVTMKGNCYLYLYRYK